MMRRVMLLFICLLLTGCNLSVSMTGDAPVSPAKPTPVYSVRPAVTFKVLADRGWQNTYVQIREGDRVNITYLEGQWTQWRGTVALHDATDSNGFTCGRSDCVEPYPDAPQGALIARIGTQIVPIGNKATFTAAMTRTLALRINDGDAGLYDNEGALQVSIVVETTAP